MMFSTAWKACSSGMQVSVTRRIPDLLVPLKKDNGKARPPGVAGWGRIVQPATLILHLLLQKSTAVFRPPFPVTDRSLRERETPAQWGGGYDKTLCLLLSGKAFDERILLMEKEIQMEEGTGQET
jgi:hypothetical protein